VTGSDFWHQAKPSNLHSACRTLSGLNTKSTAVLIERRLGSRSFVNYTNSRARTCARIRGNGLDSPERSADWCRIIRRMSRYNRRFPGFRAPACRGIEIGRQVFRRNLTIQSLILRWYNACITTCTAKTAFQKRVSRLNSHATAKSLD
jgi:hypothetical protein